MTESAQNDRPADNPSEHHIRKIAGELGVAAGQIEATARLLGEGATARLLGEGATVPFIARYRNSKRSLFTAHTISSFGNPLSIKKTETPNRDFDTPFLETTSNHGYRIGASVFKANRRTEKGRYLHGSMGGAVKRQKIS